MEEVWIRRVSKYLFKKYYKLLIYYIIFAIYKSITIRKYYRVLKLLWSCIEFRVTMEQVKTTVATKRCQGIRRGR